MPRLIPGHFCRWWWKCESDLGSGSRIPVRQKVRDACHGGTIGVNDQVFDCGVVLHLKLGNLQRMADGRETLSAIFFGLFF